MMTPGPWRPGMPFDPRVCGGGYGITGRGPFVSAEQLRGIGPIGLRPETVARMQAKSGLPTAAVQTLIICGVEPRLAEEIVAVWVRGGEHKCGKLCRFCGPPPPLPPEYETVPLLGAPVDTSRWPLGIAIAGLLLAVAIGIDRALDG